MLRRTFLFGTALALTGCAATGPISKGALSSDYAEGSVTSVVVLPLLYSSRVAAYQPTVQFELAAALQEKNPKLRFMATNEALTRLSTGDGVLASRDLSYAVFNKQEVKAEDLKKVQTVLGVDAAMMEVTLPFWGLTWMSRFFKKKYFELSSAMATITK